MTHNHMYVISWPFIFFYFQVMIYFPIQVLSSENSNETIYEKSKFKILLNCCSNKIRFSIAQGTPTSGHSRKVRLDVLT